MTMVLGARNWPGNCYNVAQWMSQHTVDAANIA